MVKELRLTHCKFAWGASSRELHYCPVSQHNFVVPLEVLKKRVDGEFKHIVIVLIQSRFTRHQLSWLLYFQFHISLFFAQFTCPLCFLFIVHFFSFLISKSNSLPYNLFLSCPWRIINMAKNNMFSYGKFQFKMFEM